MNIDYNDIVIGTCGICGGPVTTPKIWHSVTKPPKTCKNCGASAAENYGPVLPMKKSEYKAPRYKISIDSHT